MKLYIEVAVGRNELIEKIRGGHTTLRPDWTIVSSADEAHTIVTDDPAKFYPTEKVLFCTQPNATVSRGEGWGMAKITQIEFFDD